MSKIVAQEFDIYHKFVVQEFDIYHKFVDEEIKYFLPIEERKYVEISHVVGCSDFVIFVSYDKKNFGGEIKNFLLKIIEETKKVILVGTGGRFTDLS